jgi:hypothetical protein
MYVVVRGTFGLLASYTMTKMKLNTYQPDSAAVKGASHQHYLASAGFTF